MPRPKKSEVIKRACYLLNAFPSTERGAPRNVNSSLKALITAITRATGINGSANIRVANEKEVLAKRSSIFMQI